MRVLVIGDGDLSFSLALKRAYPNTIESLIATTLLESLPKLIETYPHSESIINKLLESTNNDHVIMSEILYGVDATQLHKHPKLIQFHKESCFNLILFQHPHLGYQEEENYCKEQHCQDHSSLLAHYFYSALKLLQVGNSPSSSSSCCIHVCLSPNAAGRWGLDQLIHRLKLEYTWGSPYACSRPILPPICDRIQHDPTKLKKQQQHYKAGGKRRGHWLGRFGYRHQPTFPNKTRFQTNVSDSCHYFLKPQKIIMDDGHFTDFELDPDPLTSDKGFQCSICLQTFVSMELLQAHNLAPALPGGYGLGIDKKKDW